MSTAPISTQSLVIYSKSTALISTSWAAKALSTFLPTIDRPFNRLSSSPPTSEGLSGAFETSAATAASVSVLLGWEIFFPLLSPLWILHVSCCVLRLDVVLARRPSCAHVCMGHKGWANRHVVFCLGRTQAKATIAISTSRRWFGTSHTVRGVSIVCPRHTV